MEVIVHTGARTNKQSTDPWDCTIPLNLSGYPKGAGSYTVSLVDVQIDWTWYPINSENNRIDLIYSAGNASVTIPEGVYTTLSSIATAIQTAITAALGGGDAIVVGSSTLTGKLTYTFTSGGSTTLSLSGSSPAHAVLGLKTTLALPTTVATVAPYVADLNHNDVALIQVHWPGVRSYVLWGGDAAASQRVSTTEPVMGIVQVNETWGQKCSYLQQPTRFTSHQLPSEISVSLRNTHGQFMNNNGIDFTLTFVLYDLPGIANSENHVIVDSGSGAEKLSNAFMGVPMLPGNDPGRPLHGARANKRMRTDDIDARAYGAAPLAGTGYSEVASGRKPQQPPA